MLAKPYSLQKPPVPPLQGLPRLTYCCSRASNNFGNSFSLRWGKLCFCAQRFDNDSVKITEVVET